MKLRELIKTEKKLQKLYLTDNNIDSARFMASSLSDLFNNLGEGIDKIKCKNCTCCLF